MSSSSSKREIRNEFGWSFSRDRLFNRCPRAFYWHYYGSWGGWLDDAPASAKTARRLKKLDRLTMIVGKVVHEVIARALRTRPGLPSNVPIQRLHHEVESAFDRVLTEGELFESYYGIPIPDGLVAGERMRTHALIEAFASHGYARRLFTVPKERILVADENNFDHKKVPHEIGVLWGNPDVLVYGDDGTPHLIDWKTGAASRDDELQLAVYALFASLKFGVDPLKAVGHTIYLSDGDVHTTHISANAMADAESRIAWFGAAVTGRLTNVSENEAADIERFPMTENQHLCVTCNFRELCNRSAEAVPF